MSPAECRPERKVNENQDRLMDQILEEAARKNGPPDLRTKIMAAASNKAPRVTGKLIALPQRRMRVLPIAITAIAALIVLAVLVNIDFVREMVTRANSGTGATSAGLEPQRQPATNQATEEPKPIRAPSVSDGSAVQPSREQPKEQPKPDHPKPEDPRKPDEVKKPEEKPPEERKPDGEVEKPSQPEETKPPEQVEKPKPDGTEVLKPEPVVAHWRHQGQWTYGLKITYPNDGRSRPEKDGTRVHGEEEYPVYSGALISAQCFTFTLANSGKLYLTGEVSIVIEQGGLRLDITKDDFFIDNMGTGKPLKVSMGELSMDVREGAAMFSHTSSGLAVMCTDGQIDAENKAILAGHTATLGKRGLSAIREMTKKQWDEPMLGNIPARVMHVETFDEEPEGGIYGGKIDDDILHCKGHGEYVAFRFNPTLKLLPRMAVRFSVRYSKAKRLQLEMFEQGNDQPWLIHLAPEQGDWVEVTVKFDELRLREKPDARLSADTLLRNFKLYVEGEKDASLEIDWVEFVRLGPGE
jgi:outer membrane biosynthesis protein TonB